MADAQDRDIRTYSKGMRQRIKMATAIVHDPAVLLLDEPFNGMDPRQRLHLMELLHELGDHGRTILFSSHILEEVEQIAGRIEVMVAGRHAASGDFREIRRLMTQRPHQYTIRSSDDRALASLLIADPSTSGVELATDSTGGSAVQVQATDFSAFIHAVPRVASAGGHPAARGHTGRRVPRERLLLPGEPMNATVATLTSRSLLGRRRTLVLLLLPVALLALCTLARVLAGLDADIRRELEGTLAPGLLSAFGIAVLMPLLGLIAGTGSIGPEIDEGSIVYLLAKPLNRYSIVVTKLMVAIGVVVAFGVLPIAVAGVVLTGEPVRSRSPSPSAHWRPGSRTSRCSCSSPWSPATLSSSGCIYALIWESLVGGLVPGAQALSVQQWSLAVVGELLGDSASRLGVDSAVGFGTGLVLLVLVTVVGDRVRGAAAADPAAQRRQLSAAVDLHPHRQENRPKVNPVAQTVSPGGAGCRPRLFR